ncbi:hypothetical protein [Labilibacter marinus]|uniref:hypothetical protein n=1 Tax=Labilibacter marinus TaxID=1477105 RepID=UPI00117B57EC|nr:hypothetical protein [Labilibacter marinus]
MKNIKILSIIALILMTLACDEDYEAPYFFTDVEWKMSETPLDTMFALAQDDYISFVDLSQGASSHQWTIDEGCYFLRPEFSKSDTVYTDFIDQSVGNMSSEARAHILFAKSGIKEVHLYNTYPDSAAFISAEDDTIPTVRMGDEWVIDTTFLVDVYAHIEPAFKVYFGETLVKEVLATDIPSEEDRPTWDTVTVEVGQELTYVDLTTIGRPNRRTWMMDGGVPATSNDSSANIAYYKMGVATGSVNVSRAGDLPQGSTSKLIPLIVKVVQSSQPFEYTGKAQEIGDKLIGFNVTGEVADFFGEEANFTVRAKNIGFDETIEVSGAKVSSTDATMIELTLADEVYNTDSVWITYAGGNIQSLDERELQAFEDKLVSMEIGGAVTNSTKMGFETPSANFKKGFADGWWVGNQNPVVFARTEDLAAKGVASMSCTFDGSGTTFKAAAAAFLANGAVAPAGPYIEKIKVYVDENTTLKVFRTYMTTPAYTNAWDISEIEKGTWVTLTKKVEITGQPTKNYGVRINDADNPGVTGTQLIYFDDMELIPLEARP